jgi:hypothetical protein
MNDLSGIRPVVNEAAPAQGKIVALSSQSTLKLGGAPYAMGVEHGLRLGRDILRLEREFLAFLGQLYGGGSRGRHRAHALYLMARLFAGAMALRSWPGRFRDELRGIAAGMRRAGYGGFGLTRLAVINSFDDLAGAWARRSIACSAFAVRGAHRGIIVGRNLDYQVIPDSLTALNTMFVYQSAGYTPFASWGWPGYIGVATGVNAKRLSLSLLTSPTRDASPFGVPEGLVNRVVLEEADTPGGAFDRVKSLPRTVGTNLLVATPDYAGVIESSRSHLAFRDMQAERLIVTNHFQAPEMARWQSESIRTRNTPLEDRFLSLEGSRQRACTLAAMLRGGMTASEAICLLTHPALVSGGQVQSVGMDLARGEVWMAVGTTPPACSSGYRRLGWNDLFV